MGVAASFFVGIAFVLSRIYSRALDGGQVPPEWSNDGGLRAQLYRGMQSSAKGNWKSAVKRIWLGFLVADLVVIIIVLVV